MKARFDIASAAMLLLVLSACGSTERGTATGGAAAGQVLGGGAGFAAPPPPPAAKVSPQSAAPLAAVTQNVEIVHRIAAPATIIEPMPTGVVLLKRGHEARNMAFCMAFFATYDSEHDALLKNQTQNMLQTFWPERQSDKPFPNLSPSDTPAKRAEDCRQLIEDYDYKRADWYLSSIHGYLLKSAKRLPDPAGPVLLAITSPDPSKDNLVIDASGLTFDPRHLDGSDFAPLIKAWNRAGAQATMAAERAMQRREIGKARPVARVVAKPAAEKTAMPDCLQQFPPVKMADYELDVTLKTQGCVGRAAAPVIAPPAAPRDQGITRAAAYVDPDTNSAVAFVCNFADLLADTPIKPLAEGITPGFVWVIGEYGKKAICSGTAARVLKGAALLIQGGPGAG